jgi:tetratricopeptide (TPR) repeat protein
MRALAIALLVVALPARAEDVHAPDEEIARRRFEAGSRAYERGEYPAALVEFEAARKVKPLPGLDYNIGRCLDRMERPREAIEAYRRYLVGAPDAKDAPQVYERLRVLEARVTPDRPRARPEASPVEVTAPAPRRPSVAAPLAIGVAAIVSVVVASALVASVRGPYDDLNATCPYPCPEAQWSHLAARANAGYGLWAAGGALVAVDVGLWIWWARGAR